MAKRKNLKARSSMTVAGKKLKAMYARVRKEFSAADLQKYTEIEEGIPLDTVIAEAQRIHREITAKQLDPTRLYRKLIHKNRDHDQRKGSRRAL